MEFVVARKRSPKPAAPPEPEPRDDSPGAKLRRLVDRKRRGREYQEIAEAAGMDPRAFSRLLKGRVPNPGILTITAILKAIGATLAEYEKA